MEIPFAFFQSRSILVPRFFRSHSFSPAVTYATKQLTQALQELTARSQHGGSTPQKPVEQTISFDHLQVAKEVEQFLDKSQAYASETRHISIGSY